jgi:hypothetical protein
VERLPGLNCRELRDAYPALPSGLDQPPPSLNLFRKIGACTLIRQAEEIRGEADRLRRSLFLVEEPDTLTVSPEVVESIQYVAKSVLYRCITQLLVGVLIGKASLAFPKERAFLEGALLRCLFEVTTESCRVWESEIIKPDRALKSLEILATPAGLSSALQFPETPCKRTRSAEG